MKKICSQPSLWKIITLRRFGDTCESVLSEFGNYEDCDWKSLYLALQSFFQSKILDSHEQKLVLNKMCACSTQQWRLLYRGTENGFDAESFHGCCDDHKGTVVVVQSENGSIFGGYTPCKWHSYTSYSCNTKETFLFQLRNVEGKDVELKLRNDGKFKRSIYGAPKLGVVFGFGHDLFIAPNADKNEESFSDLGASFTVPGIPSGSKELESFLSGKKNFRVKEIEIFQKIEFHHNVKSRKNHA